MFHGEGLAALCEFIHQQKKKKDGMNMLVRADL